MDFYKSPSPTSTFPESQSVFSHNTETKSSPTSGKVAQFTEQAAIERCDPKDLIYPDMAKQVRPDFEKTQRAVQRAVQTRIAAQLQSASVSRTGHDFCSEETNTGAYGSHSPADSETFPHTYTNDIQSSLHSEPYLEEQSADFSESQKQSGGKESQRKKIKIQLIRDPRSRQVTFLKRKNGLMKKAMELVSFS